MGCGSVQRSLVRIVVVLVALPALFVALVMRPPIVIRAVLMMVFLAPNLFLVVLVTLTIARLVVAVVGIILPVLIVMILVLGSSRQCHDGECCSQCQG